MSISIKLPDGSIREYEEEASIEDVAASISCGLENAVAGKLNGKLVNLSTPLQDGAHVEIVTRDSAEGQKIVRRKNSRGTGRIVALDAARGLAVIGMYLQHFALNETNGSIVSGNTTLLFVLCGGISYSIMAGRMMDRGTDPAAFRTRMLARLCGTVCAGVGARSSFDACTRCNGSSFDCSESAADDSRRQRPVGSVLTW